MLKAIKRILNYFFSFCLKAQNNNPPPIKANIPYPGIVPKADIHKPNPFLEEKIDSLN